VAEKRKSKAEKEAEGWKAGQVRYWRTTRSAQLPSDLTVERERQRRPEFRATRGTRLALSNLSRFPAPNS